MVSHVRFGNDSRVGCHPQTHVIHAELIVSHSGVYIVSGIRHPMKHSVSLFCVGSVCCSSKEVPGFILVIIIKVVTGHTCNEENPLGYISKLLFALLLFVKYLESHWMPSVVAFLELQADVAKQLYAG